MLAEKAIKSLRTNSFIKRKLWNPNFWLFIQPTLYGTYEIHAGLFTKGADNAPVTEDVYEITGEDIMAKDWEVMEEGWRPAR